MVQVREKVKARSCSKHSPCSKHGPQSIRKTLVSRKIPLSHPHTADKTFRGLSERSLGGEGEGLLYLLATQPHGSCPVSVSNQLWNLDFNFLTLLDV